MKTDWKRHAKKLVFEKGDAIFFREEEVKGLYILESGTLVAEMLKENGEVKQIEKMEGETFLATAFIFGAHPYYPVDLRAETESTVYFIPKKVLLKFFQQEPEMLEVFIEDMSNKAQFLSSKIWSQFQYKSLGGKLNQYLLEHENNGICKFDRSLKELAEFFDVTRPSLSRALSRYVEEGILERKGRNCYKILKKGQFK